MPIAIQPVQNCLMVILGAEGDKDYSDETEGHLDA